MSDPFEESAVVFTGPSGSGKTTLINKIYKKEFPAGPGGDHVTTKMNEFNYQGDKVLDLVGDGNAYYAKYKKLRIIYLCGTGRIDEDRKKWEKQHPKLKENVQFVLSWHLTKLYGVEIKKKIKEDWQFLEDQDEKRLHADIPDNPLWQSKKGSKSSENSGPTESSAAPKQIMSYVPRVIDQIILPVMSLDKATMTFINKKYLTTEVIDEKCLHGNMFVNFICTRHGLTQSQKAWDNETMASYVKDKIPKLNDYIEEICRQKNKKVDDVMIGNALETIILYCEESNNEDKKLKKASRVIGHSYIKYVIDNNKPREKENK